MKKCEYELIPLPNGETKLHIVIRTEDIGQISEVDVENKYFIKTIKG